MAPHDDVDMKATIWVGVRLHWRGGRQGVQVLVPFIVEVPDLKQCAMTPTSCANASQLLPKLYATEILSKHCLKREEMHG